MGILSAVIGKAANVRFIRRYTASTRPSLTLMIDKHPRSNLHLCRSLHRDGHRGCSIPIRAIRPTQRLIVSVYNTYSS